MSVETRFKSRNTVVAGRKPQPVPDTAGSRTPIMPMIAPHRIEERTVFLLEDDPLIVSDIEGTLEDFGWRVSHRANTLEDGMRIARSAQFDVAIVDVNLDGRESYPVALVVSERNIPLILCTGYALQALRDRFPEIPILPKPFPAETLRAMLEQVSLTRH